MKKDFVIRGQTASGKTEVLNFSGFKPGMAYRLTEFNIFPSISIGAAQPELSASITAGKTAVDPPNPNFNNEGLIGNAIFVQTNSATEGTGPAAYSIVNDTFLITQNLILMVQDAGASGTPVNWQCRFESVKMTGPEEASVNYKQFAISDE